VDVNRNETLRLPVNQTLLEPLVKIAGLSLVPFSARHYKAFKKLSIELSKPATA
jgi:hypothetical protein